MWFNSEDYYKNLQPYSDDPEIDDLERVDDALSELNNPWQSNTDLYYYPQPQKKGNLKEIKSSMIASKEFLKKKCQFVFKSYFIFISSRNGSTKGSEKFSQQFG